MSTDTKASKTNLQDLAAAYIQEREDAKKRNTEFNAEFQERIKFFNTVVRNLATKFNSPELSFSQIYNQLSISPSSELSHVNTYSGEYMIGSRSISMSLLRNDPIAISVYVRREIRRMQVEQRALAYKNAKVAQDRAKSELAALQRKVDDATAIVDGYDKRMKSREKYILKRAEHKMKVRAKARELQATV
jgi:hypothetical protein